MITAQEIRDAKVVLDANYKRTVPIPVKTICTGCRRAVVPKGERCERCKAKPIYKAPPKPRETTAERGYVNRWTESSKHYRHDHPLCVPCQLRERITASRCVDHIVPRHSCEELFWDQDNWCAMCWYCHGVKTKKEPQAQWIPRDDRIVICGLPGTGKTTYASTLGLPYWDADEHSITSIDQIQAKRGQWIAAQREGFAVIVASPLTASLIACAIQGRAKHMAQVWVNRPCRAVPE